MGGQTSTRHISAKSTRLWVRYLHHLYVLGFSYFQPKFKSNAGSYNHHIANRKTLKQNDFKMLTSEKVIKSISMLSRVLFVSFCFVSLHEKGLILGTRALKLTGQMQLSIVEVWPPSSPWFFSWGLTSVKIMAFSVKRQPTVMQEAAWKARVRNTEREHTRVLGTKVAFETQVWWHITVPVMAIAAPNYAESEAFYTVFLLGEW